MVDADPARLERLVLATGNPDKVAELVRLLDGRFEVVPRPSTVPETVEDQPTLVGNARKKATEIALASSAPALSDDTGLFVNALGGGPGVRTARYAGENATYDDNVDKLLTELENAADRGAQFRTVVAIVWPDGRELIANGSVDGMITPERRGERGFGYDPVFAPLEADGRTFAEMSLDEKGELSHRARALAALLAQFPSA
ncbi:MAG: XTP/dITP diphosphohydrolase [Acidimicrobiales bacterium]|jgi:XTP/dITP diphosphohydrolase